MKAGRGGARSAFPIAAMGRGGRCKYGKSRLDWCGQAEGAAEGRAAEGLMSPEGETGALSLSPGPTCSHLMGSDSTRNTRRGLAEMRSRSTVSGSKVSNMSLLSVRFWSFYLFFFMKQNKGGEVIPFELFYNTKN